MENNKNDSFVVCGNILFSIEGNKSSQYLHSKYNLGTLSGKTLTVKNYELLFLYFRGKVKPVNSFFNNALNLMSELMEESDLHKFKVYLELKNEGAKITIDKNSFLISKKNENLNIKRVIFPIRENSKLSVEWLLNARGHNIASVDDDGDITYYRIDSVDLMGANSNQLLNTDFIRGLGKRAIGNLDTKPEWMGDKIYDMRILSESETDYINGVENPDMVSRIYRKLIFQGLIVKTGFKYGCNFRAYTGSMDDHSDFLIHVLSDSVEWYEISRAVRVAASVRKDMIFAGFVNDKSFFINIKRIKSVLEMNLRD